MRFSRFEHISQPVASRYVFFRRWANSILIAAMIILASLIGGIVGYHFFEGRPWIDAFEEAAMILSGMGPLGDSQTVGGKLFAGFFALYSGLVLVVATGIILAPILHRVLHHFHVEEEDA